MKKNVFKLTEMKEFLKAVAVRPCTATTFRLVFNENDLLKGLYLSVTNTLYGGGEVCSRLSLRYNCNDLELFNNYLVIEDTCEEVIKSVTKDLVSFYKTLTSMSPAAPIDSILSYRFYSHLITYRHVSPLESTHKPLCDVGDIVYIIRECSRNPQHLQSYSVEPCFIFAILMSREEQFICIPLHKASLYKSMTIKELLFNYQLPFYTKDDIYFTVSDADTAIANKLMAEAQTFIASDAERFDKLIFDYMKQSKVV